MAGLLGRLDEIRADTILNRKLVFNRQNKPPEYLGDERLGALRGPGQKKNVWRFVQRS